MERSENPHKPGQLSWLMSKSDGRLRRRPGSITPFGPDLRRRQRPVHPGTRRRLRGHRQRESGQVDLRTPVGRRELCDARGRGGGHPGGVLRAVGRQVDQYIHPGDV